MENCEMSIDSDDILIIRIDLKQELGPNQRGSIIIGTSRGNCQLWKNGRPHPRNIKVNVTAFRRATIEELRSNKWHRPEQSRE